MPKRSKAQTIGQAGEAIAREIIGTDQQWIVRGQERDFGFDLEAELRQRATSNSFRAI